MNKFLKILCTLVVLVIMFLPTTAFAKEKQLVSFTKQSKDIYNTQIGRNMITPFFCTDFDPLDENIIVTVTIKEIRAIKTIDVLSKPDFYVKVTINNKEFISDVWQNMIYVENLNWSASYEVPKDNEFVNVTIALWDKGNGIDHLCDISPDSGNFTQARTAELTYSIATGIWWGRGDSIDDDNYMGDDYLGDPSGYGRLSGIDDNSVYEQDGDCEFWFTISQNDFDGDGFPYWLEVNMYNTSPLMNNRGEDADNDGVPLEWEYRFGLTYSEWGHHDEGYFMEYDPFRWENHSTLDPDNDGLDNIEEFRTWQWGSDPFRQDIFIELDQMEKGPNGEGSIVPIEAFDLLRDSYARHNIVWHIDDGRLGGGEFIHFKENYTDNDIDLWYWNYFMHGDAQNWRRGVFRWCIMPYNGYWANGFTFGSEINRTFALDCFLIATSYHEMRSKILLIIDGLNRGTFNREMNRAYVYAGAIMHETGHTLGCHAPGCDVQDSQYPWQLNYWRFAPYKSCMNYRYIYKGVVDYSDGSHGKNDYDDWGNIDLTLINPRIRW